MINPNLDSGITQRIQSGNDVRSGPGFPLGCIRERRSGARPAGVVTLGNDKKIEGNTGLGASDIQYALGVFVRFQDLPSSG